MPLQGLENIFICGEARGDELYMNPELTNAGNSETTVTIKCSVLSVFQSLSYASCFLSLQGFCVDYLSLEPWPFSVLHFFSAQGGWSLPTVAKGTLAVPMALAGERKEEGKTGYLCPWRCLSWLWAVSLHPEVQFLLGCPLPTWPPSLGPRKWPSSLSSESSGRKNFLLPVAS